MDKTWLTTGCSTGLGRALAEAAAARSARIVATARSAAALEDLLDRYSGTVRVLIVEPGPFRTELPGRSIASAARPIDAYAQTTQVRRHRRERNDGKRAGAPAKAVAVMLQAADADDPPLHLPSGPAAHRIVARKLEALRADIAAWRDVSIASDFAHAG